MNRFVYGVCLKHRLRVEVDNEPEDPTSITVNQVMPNGTQVSLGTPIKEAKGLYTVQKTYTATTASLMWGTWDTQWIGAGVAEGAAIRQHFINSSRFS